MEINDDAGYMTVNLTGAGRTPTPVRFDAYQTHDDLRRLREKFPDADLDAYLTALRDFLTKLGFPADMTLKTLLAVRDGIYRWVQDDLGNALRASSSGTPDSPGTSASGSAD